MKLSRLACTLAGLLAVLCAAAATNARSGGADGRSAKPLAGIVSEVRLGVFDHDVGIISSDTEDGFDFNAELLLVSPGLFRYLLSPRPQIGVAINSEDVTNQVYAGLAWTFDMFEFLFIEASIGGTVHDGNIDRREVDRNAFGCELLFRATLSLGVRLDAHQSLAVMASHISNAGLCDHNDGLDNVGIRYGYRF